MEPSIVHTLSVRGLAVGYGKRSVAGHIAFDLDPGLLCGIVGVNGIGKSTLLRTLAGFQPKLAGEIKIWDRPLESISAMDLARQLSVVLTEQPASKNLSVHELIALGRQPHTDRWGMLSAGDREAVRQSLDTFLLGEFAQRKCHELSDGQLQRVLIARAMAQDTPLMLLDEPTTHLDLYHKVQILKLLRTLAHESQRTVLFSTHEIELAIQLCDRILILDGRDNPFGTPGALIQQGQFGRLFPENMVSFDPVTGTFKVNK